MPFIYTVEDLRERFAVGRPQFLDLWVETDDGQSMCGLVNGEAGWLMYLREGGDAGFSSRAPDYNGPEDASREYYLDNGQCDEYPAAWALPDGEIQRALEHFITRAEPAPWIIWHNDSGDGATIGRVA
jgi:hypothetical protein